MGKLRISEMIGGWRSGPGPERIMLFIIGALFIAAILYGFLR